MAGLSREEQLESLMGQVQDSVRSILGTEVGVDEPLMASGLDSLGAVEVHNSLERMMGVDLPGTLVFDYPSIREIAGYFGDLMGLVENVPELGLHSHGDQFPGVAILLRGSSIHEDRLVTHCLSVDFISIVPLSRWDVDVVFPPIRFGGFYADIELFDVCLFGLSAAEAQMMDPQQRLLLFCSCNSLSTLRHSKIACYVGLSVLDYARLAASLHMQLSPFLLTSMSGSMTAGRIAFTFGLVGPAATVDTACSSSMVAAKLAMDCLSDRTVKDALACGVSLSIVHESSAIVHAAGMLSADGRCKSMDDSANGYGRGEGCASFVFTCMVEDGSADTYHSSVAALAASVNQNGTSSSLVAPRGPAQEELMKYALHLAGKCASDLKGMQLHSNGTLLGDPIEIGAILSVFLQQQQHECFHLSSAKGFLGHEEAAAGAMLLLHCKVLIEGFAIAPMLHVRSINRHVGFALESRSNGKATHFPRESLPSSRGMEFSMGVNSFGAQGTNAHIILGTTEFVPSISTSLIYNYVWHKQRHWIAPNVSWLQSICTAWRDHAFIEVDLGCVKNADMMDNRIMGTPVFPQSSFLALATATASAHNPDAGCSLEKVSFASHACLHPRESILAKFILDSEGGFELSVPLAQSNGKRIGDTLCMQGQWSFYLEGNPMKSFSGSTQSHLICLFQFKRSTLLLHGLDVVSLHRNRASHLDGRALHSLIGRCSLKSGGNGLRSVGSAHFPAQPCASSKIWISNTKDPHAYQDSAPLTNNIHMIGVVSISYLVFGSMEIIEPQTLTQQVSAGLKQEFHTPQFYLGHVAKELEGLEQDERIKRLQMKVTTEVSYILGREVGLEEPLMESGLDSRAGMELLQKVSDSLGAEMPITLLYDYETVGQIAEYLDNEITFHLTEKDGKLLTRSPVAFGKVESIPVDDGEPSKRLKTVRGSHPMPPLFLAAPAVANAQAAYFAFKSFLDWSEHPIFALENDDTLSVKELAICHAMDIIAVQPEGPYLLGGHSYGGVVAVQIALQLQEWGRQVGVVILFDAPHPLQFRPITTDGQVTEDEANEMMEFILNAIGEETVGLSTRGQKWLSMGMQERYEFLTPIWRLRGGANLSVQNVRDQIYHIAGAMKRGDQVSDLRHHKFESQLHSAPLLYFRASHKGACPTFNDSEESTVPHGKIWSEIAETIEVIDVPGDHFTLLRQSNPNMSILVSVLRSYLEPFGGVAPGSLP